MLVVILDLAMAYVYALLLQQTCSAARVSCVLLQVRSKYASTVGGHLVQRILEHFCRHWARAIRVTGVHLFPVVAKSCVNRGYRFYIRTFYPVFAAVVRVHEMRQVSTISANNKRTNRTADRLTNDAAASLPPRRHHSQHLHFPVQSSA